MMGASLSGWYPSDPSGAATAGLAAAWWGEEVLRKELSQLLLAGLPPDGQGIVVYMRLEFQLEKCPRGNCSMGRPPS